MIKQGFFDCLSDGRKVYSYTIYNAKGEYVEILDYGASIHKICILDNRGSLGDVVMGVADGKQLEKKMSFEGSTIGRVANRIRHGKCVVDNKELQLECNMNGHFLHGAGGNYANRLFQVEAIDEKKNEITFSLDDNGEGGFGNRVKVMITFRFDDSSALHLSYCFIPEDTTVISPTNHVYFNLSGRDVRDQILHIYSDKKACRDEYGILCGGTESVKGTPADFTIPRKIRDGIESDREKTYFTEIPERYDEFYVLPDKHTDPATELYDPETGRKLTVYTDMQCLIIFNNIEKQPVKAKDGKIYEGYCGISLETQFVPNAVNCQDYHSPVFHKGEKYQSETTYVFSVKGGKRE